MVSVDPEWLVIGFRVMAHSQARSTTSAPVQSGEAVSSTSVSDVRPACDS